MKKLYTYNPRTRTLHISGYCANSAGPGYEQFSTEERALAAHAGQVLFCKNCKRKIVSLIKQNKQRHF